MKMDELTPYSVSIDFDGASKSWMSNKKKNKKGEIKYICGYEKLDGSKCQRSKSKKSCGWGLCAAHKNKIRCDKPRKRTCSRCHQPGHDIRICKIQKVQSDQNKSYKYLPLPIINLVSAIKNGLVLPYNNKIPMFITSDKKIYNCDKCDFSCIGSSNLEIHRGNNHNHKENGIDFLCSAVFDE